MLQLREDLFVALVAPPKPALFFHEPLFTNPNDETSERTTHHAPLRVVRHSGFGFLSSFVIRYSSFNDLCNSGSWCQSGPHVAWRLSMNRPFGVPASAGSDRLKAGHQTSGVPHTGSWCQSGPHVAWGLSMNRPTPQPLPGGEQAFVRVPSVPLLGGVRGGFMAPMHAQRE